MRHGGFFAQKRIFGRIQKEFTMRQLLHNTAAQMELLEKGWVKLPLLNKEEVESLSNEIKQLKPDDGYNPSDESDAVKLMNATYHCTFLDKNHEYKRRVHELVHKYFADKINKMLVDYQILAANFYVKVHGRNNALPVHQNWTITESIYNSPLTIWCPLIDCDRVNGTLQVVTGSHKIVSDISCLYNIDYFKNFTDSLKEKWFTAIDAKAGECVIIDDSLLHYTGDNMGKELRITVQVETLPKECRPVLYYCDHTVPFSDLEIFEVNTEFFNKHDQMALTTRPSHLKSVGIVPNPNRYRTEEEFEALMKNGRERRKRIYKENLQISLN